MNTFAKRTSRRMASPFPGLFPHVCNIIKYRLVVQMHEIELPYGDDPPNGSIFLNVLHNSIRRSWRSFRRVDDIPTTCQVCALRGKHYHSNRNWFESKDAQYIAAIGQ
jgi:hypothetical protein